MFVPYESKEIMKNGSFNLKKWRSGSESINKEKKNEGAELREGGEDKWYSFEFK